MIKFDENGIVNIDLLGEDEARMFIVFLYTELHRHEKDIAYIKERTKKAADRFGWGDIRFDLGDR